MANISFPKPRYEVRQMGQRAEKQWCAWDTVRLCFVYGAETAYQREAERTVVALNREYQRWLTDRFYDRAETV